MKERILIVDDHEDFRVSVRNFLKKSSPSLEIYEASTGEMGVTKANLIKPHIVLMDLNLPGENGFDASLQIKEDNPDCDVIILTMFEIESFKKLAHQSHAKEFIGKSEVHERLIPSIQRLLARRNGKKKTINCTPA